MTLCAVGSGHLVAAYIDFESGPDNDPSGLAELFRPGIAVEWYRLGGGRVRAVQWLTERPGERPATTAPTPTPPPPGDAEDRLRAGCLCTVVREGDGLVEIRFDDDGYHYIVKT